jgi:small-conductance mechanosensitive channel
MNSSIDIAVSLAIVAGAFFLGVLVSQTLKRIFVPRAQARGMTFSPAALSSVRGPLPVIFALTAFLLVLDELPLSKRWHTFSEEGAYVLLIIAASIFIARFAATLVNMSTRSTRGRTQKTATILVNLTRLVILLIGFLVMLNSLGVSITPMLTALGVGGLAVGLALQDTLSNFFAGIQLTLMRDIEVGDVIRISSGNEGILTDIGWRVSTIRIGENTLIIPNNKLSTDLIINYSLPGPLVKLVMNLRFAYGTDLVLAERVVLDLAQQVLADHEGGVLDPPPMLFFREFGDTGVLAIFTVRVKKDFFLGPIRNELIKKLDIRFKENGIVIPVVVPAPPKPPGS